MTSDVCPKKQIWLQSTPDPIHFRAEIQMSETRLTIPLGELILVRVMCAYCEKTTGAWVEVPVGKLDRLYSEGKCPVCHERIFLFDEKVGERNPFIMLANSMGKLEELAAKVKVDFVIARD
jgi:hypothetical protein